MFLTSNLFWFLMGMLSILVGVGFKYFAEDRGWKLNWWKWLLCISWWAILSVSIYASGTLTGENEAGAGMWVLLSGIFVNLVFGVIIWRILSHKPKEDEPEVVEPAAAEAQ
jgi:hypothetical protein